MYRTFNRVMSSTMSVHSTPTKLKIGPYIYFSLSFTCIVSSIFLFAWKNFFLLYFLFRMALWPCIFFSTLCNTYLLISLNFYISLRHTLPPTIQLASSLSTFSLFASFLLRWTCMNLTGNVIVPVPLPPSSSSSTAFTEKAKETSV